MFKVSEEENKKCDLCHYSTNSTSDTILFGDWMSCSDVTTHYFCLLLSTNLLQRGKDHQGILGFLLRDIRNEMRAGENRTCCFCGQPHATIACSGCKLYFHLVCGHLNECLFMFRNEFKSYCNSCMPLDNFQRCAMKKPPLSTERCYICKEQMGKYSPVTNIHANCCRTGFVHRLCMQMYALAAGYYLKCIWCKSNKFRDDIRLQGVFVPDRDAQWEQEKNAYRDIHRGHTRCDMEQCMCPRGREFNSSKWRLTVCSLCGAFGAHNPLCIPKVQKSNIKVEDFKCATCFKIEQSIANNTQTGLNKNSSENLNECINKSFYMQKQVGTFRETPIRETPSFSEDESQSSRNSSAITIINRTLGDKTDDGMLASFSSNKKVTTPKELPWNPLSQFTLQDVHKESNIDSEMPLQGSQTTAISNTLSQIIIQDTHKGSNIDLEMPLQNSQATISLNGSQGKKSNNELIMQSPVISSSQELENVTTLDNLYIFDNNLNCLGTCRARIDLSSPRFAGRTVNEVVVSPNLLNMEDIIDRSDTKGIFEDIDNIIAAYIE